MSVKRHWESFRFIGVNPGYASTLFAGEHYRSAEKKRPTGLASFLAQSRLGRTVKNIGKQLISQEAVRQVRSALWTSAEKPTPSKDVFQKAKAYLKQDVQKLRQLTGERFASWSL
jgi:hypothetical protein